MGTCTGEPCPQSRYERRGILWHGMIPDSRGRYKHMNDTVCVVLCCSMPGPLCRCKHDFKIFRLQLLYHNTYSIWGMRWTTINMLLSVYINARCKWWKIVSSICHKGVYINATWAVGNWVKVVKLFVTHPGCVGAWAFIWTSDFIGKDLCIFYDQ